MTNINSSASFNPLDLDVRCVQNYASWITETYGETDHTKALRWAVDVAIDHSDVTSTDAGTLWAAVQAAQGQQIETIYGGTI